MEEKKPEKEKTFNFKKIQLFFAISLLTLSVLFLFQDSGITGHFSVDFKSQSLDMQITQSQKFSMSTNQNEPIHLSSFRISGEVIGEGSAEVFIDNNAGQRVLVYKNIRRREQGLPSITGFAVQGGDVVGNEEPGATTILLQSLGTIEWQNPGLALSAEEELVAGPFNNKCQDTCFIEMPLSAEIPYQLIFNIEPGTNVRLTKITYTLKDENI